jgi:adenosylcobinamide-GDP ribazoletransferase
MWLESVRALLQWTTVLPLGSPADFEAFARRSYLYPLAGYVTGGIAAIVAHAVSFPPVAAALAIAAVLFVSGCNHFDGLLDLGDGLMAHGSREVRIRALTDRQIGAGGVATGIVVTLVTFAGLLAAESIPLAILAAEVGGKAAMGVLTVTGTPFHEGMHSYLHGFARRWFIIPTLLLCLPLLLALPPAQVGATIAAVLLTVIVLQSAAGRLFGGVSGDVVGAAHEISRAAVIIALLITTPGFLGG